MAAAKRAREYINFVPTMGALHEGHMSLVREAKTSTGKVIVSIFVNPTQFAPHEDFDSYPRVVEKDCELLKAEGVHAVYLPSVEDIYPEGFATTVSVKRDYEPLEGAARPHFFDGVTTVVSKLLLQTDADKAFFGEKDFEQLFTVRRMVSDLNIKTDVIGVPTVRDQNGLALSSRNAYLSKAEYDVAIHLNKILASMCDRIKAGESLKNIQKQGVAALLDKGFEKVDYLEIRDAESLKIVDEKTGPLRILVAAHLGKARLIDNMAA